MKKESHSKVNNLEHNSYGMQKNFRSNPLKISQDEGGKNFKLRNKIRKFQKKI